MQQFYREFDHFRFRKMEDSNLLLKVHRICQEWVVLVAMKKVQGIWHVWKGWVVVVMVVGVGGDCKI